MNQPTLILDHAQGTLSGFPVWLFRLLKLEMSYPASDPGYRVITAPDGSFKTYFWDGYVSLLKNNGVFPSGLFHRVFRLLQKWKIDFRMIDNRVRPPTKDFRWDFPEGFTLRDYQREAVEAAWAMGQGVIDSPPRTGKTVMIVDLVRRVSDLTVITSPTIQIAKQTFDQLLRLLGHEKKDDFYLLVGGGPKNRKEQIAFNKALVFCSTINSALSLSDSFWKKVACIIVDERHHQASKSYHQLNFKAVSAFWRWGFTGTNYRSDLSENLALEACLGKTIVSYSIKEMQEKGVLVPATVLFYNIDNSRKISNRGNFKEIYRKGICFCESRNLFIKQIAEELIEMKKRVLILIELLAHGRKLETLIPGSVFVQSADGDDIRRRIVDLESGKIRCLIGSPVVGEGLDIPLADAVVYAKGLKAKVTHTQDIFRVLTGHNRKSRALIIDFCDRHQAKLLDHAADRLRNYISMGCEIKILDKSCAEKLDAFRSAHRKKGGSIDSISVKYFPNPST